jgi:hypothetical protein
VFSGDYDLADRLGKKLGHRSNRESVADNITAKNKLLIELNKRQK